MNWHVGLSLEGVSHIGALDQQVALFGEGFWAFRPELSADLDELVFVEVLELACEDYNVFS